MKNILSSFMALLFFSGISVAATTAPILKNQMHIEIQPSISTIMSEVTIEFPANYQRVVSFQLNKNLTVSSLDPEDRLTLVRAANSDEIASAWKIELGERDHKVTLRYSGIINDPVNDNSDSSGLISTDGTVLFGSTCWYPLFDNVDYTYEIEIISPENFKSLTQGVLISEEVANNKLITKFSQQQPQDEIYLLSGPFQRYNLKQNNLNYSVWLHVQDDQLAQTYLNLLPKYVQHFSELIGAYPYTEFSAIENLWETGYGMPSFTLLGPQIMRLPFILTSSLPHEILHNWWGNSVYVDYSTGNWCEGLTTYMADHWQQEVAHQDVAYRQNVLINYHDYVKDANDFPLKDFQGRHNESSQAIGYGKSLMLFHMLKVRLGEKIFTKAIQNFYQNNKFKVAGFSDIEKSFEAVSNENLAPFFSQWVSQKGAPTLAITQAESEITHMGTYKTTLSLKQNQPQYELTIPVRLSYSDKTQKKINIDFNDSENQFTFTSLLKVTKIEIDPEFDIFRQIYTNERPLTLSHLFGAAQVGIYTTDMTSTSDFINKFKEKFQGNMTQHVLTPDFELPVDGDLLFVGDSPQIRNLIKIQLEKQNFEISDTDIKIFGQQYKLTDSSSVIIARDQNNADRALVWIRWADNMNATEWAQRLTHYGNYGILIFQGHPLVLKNNWPIIDSPLSKDL